VQDHLLEIGGWLPHHGSRYGHEHQGCGTARNGGWIDAPVERGEPAAMMDGECEKVEIRKTCRGCAGERRECLSIRYG
jgi:hypothetical protein